MDGPAQATSGDASACFPVSVKAVIVRAGRVILLNNERDEWELPGGKLEVGEDPARCVEREVHEELDLEVRADRLLDLWQFHIAHGVDVVVAVFVCGELDRSRVPRLSREHRRLGWFDGDAVTGLPVPEGYKRSIEAALRDGAE